MNTNVEKRAYERFPYRALIVFSYFNKQRYIDSQTLDHCTNGMCIKSNFFLQPGTAVYIRRENNLVTGESCLGASNGLRFATLAEVKWCKYMHAENDSYYRVGVKYFELKYKIACLCGFVKAHIPYRHL
jgi:hypothetical protein